MQIEFWKSWILTTDQGRHIWKYKPPKSLDPITAQNPGAKARQEAWESESGRTLLTAMSKAFIFDDQKNRNSADKVFRHQAVSSHPVNIDPETIPTPNGLDEPLARKSFLSAYKGINLYKSLQMVDGHWPGDYGGPMFLLPGLVIASYITEAPFPAPHRTLMKRYLYNHQNEDGGWGLHLEGNSTVFGTALQYVALRILGDKADVRELVKARKWLKDQGGTVGIPSWGKFYLSVLGVYEWEGNNTLMPEMWLLPKALPLHPWRYWCHSRMVYLPMAYCYANRVTGNLTELVKDLRQELYIEDYDRINWPKMRDQVADPDMYYLQSRILKVVNLFLNLYEKFHIKGLRSKACAFIEEYLDAEDVQTRYVNIGPVNQVMNSLCVWHRYGDQSPQLKKHVERWADYLWVAEDGMKMCGYNGSQLWDTAFATQAILEGGMEHYFPEAVRNAYRFIDTTQIREDVDNRERFFRHISKGGWPFSTGEQGWPTSDCTAEGLRTAILVHRSGLLSKKSVKTPPINPERLKDAVNVILSFQNTDRGWATYENTRGPAWLEQLNPSEIFGGIMIDYSYTECTSACIQALLTFQSEEPDHRKQEIDRAVRQGIEFIKDQQREDGSWYGSWAICFTYATWFGVEALLATGHATYAAGTDHVDTHIQQACEFLLSKQNVDGGWGESFESCVEKRYVPHPESQIVNSSWALMTLMAADFPDPEPIQKGIRFLLSRQQQDGDWPQESISGVFNHNCMITYTAYRNVFPIWALSRYFSGKLDR